jgi:signal transduction histidine kinase
MIEFQVMGPDSTTILNTLDDAYPFRATIRSGGPLEGLTVTAALAADQIPIRLNVGSTERLHLGVLLVATILVVGFAMGSSRRELLLARARSDFIAGVSHDLRMPLAQILIAGETLTLERERDAEDRRALSHAIVREARRLVGIVDNVLLFSRTGATRQKPRLRPVPVDDLFDDVIEAAGLAVDDAAQSIAVRAPSSLLVLGDRQLLRQALVNLVDNALKYGPRGQHIELGAELASATAVRLYVDDHGPGIPAEERARLFEPYERMFRDRTSERTGSGLGLAVVREIAAALDGRAWLADAPGGGTRAVIELRHAEQVTAASSTVGMG